MAEYRFGGYKLCVEDILNVSFDEKGRLVVNRPVRSRVSMYDLGNLRFPLMWSKTMGVDEAKGAVDLFNLTGCFPMPVTTEVR